MKYNYHSQVFRKVREDLGLKQRELALILGCTESALRNYETGRQSPNGYVVHLLSELCQRAGFSRPQLYDIPEDPYAVLPRDRRPPPTVQLSTNETPDERNLTNLLMDLAPFDLDEDVTLLVAITSCRITTLEDVLQLRQSADMQTSTLPTGDWIIRPTVLKPNGEYFVFMAPCKTSTLAQYDRGGYCEAIRQQSILYDLSATILMDRSLADAIPRIEHWLAQRPARIKRFHNQLQNRTAKREESKVRAMARRPK